MKNYGIAAWGNLCRCFYKDDTRCRLIGPKVVQYTGRAETEKEEM
jgi:hypothetical protein